MCYYQYFGNHIWVLIFILNYVKILFKWKCVFKSNIWWKQTFLAFHCHYLKGNWRYWKSITQQILRNWKSNWKSIWFPYFENLNLHFSKFCTYPQHQDMIQFQHHWLWRCIFPCSCKLASWQSVDGWSFPYFHPQGPQFCIVCPWRFHLPWRTILPFDQPCWRWLRRQLPFPGTPWCSCPWEEQPIHQVS